MERTADQTHAVAAGLGLFTVVLVVIAIMLIPSSFYLLMLPKALHRCSPESQAMKPGLVSLLFIPLFNIVWQFLVVLNIAKSLGAEFRKRGMAKDPNPGQTLGLVMCIGKLICGPVGLVCWILYWIKIAGYSGNLVVAPGPVAA